MDLDYESMVIVAGVLALIAGGAAVVVLRRTPKHSALGRVLAEAARVVLDVQQRSLESFILASLKGSQLRNALFQGNTRISYSLRRQPNGVEHQMSVSVEGKGPPVEGSAQDQKDLAELARLAVFITLLAKLEPIDPLDVDVQKRQMGVTRTLTELQTRELKRTAHIPPEAELLSQYEQAGLKSKGIWRGPG